MTDISTKTTQLEKISLYGNRRLFRAIVCAVIASSLMQDISYGLLIYPIASVFWDWWFFSYKGIKESTSIPQWYLDNKKMTSEEVDKYVRVTMYAKRVILAISFVFAVINSLISESIIRIDVIIYYTFMMMLFMIPMVIFKIIKTPYMTSFKRDYYSYHLNDRSNDMFDIGNITGYLNPASPLYIHRNIDK